MFNQEDSEDNKSDENELQSHRQRYKIKRVRMSSARGKFGDVEDKRWVRVGGGAAGWEHL